MEERLQLAVFIDFDNIEIGVKSTLNTELDLSLVLEALKERGEVVSKSAYGDWARAGMHSRTLTEHAVHMVQRNVTPRGDKNGADINLVVDALEMAFTRPHINGFAIVGGDSDFIALVEKLKQFGKRVFVVGGRSFTSGILQRNCHEFISYENLLAASRGGRGGGQAQRRGPVTGRLPVEQGVAQVQRALKILADRGVEPQLGPLKSTLLQLDSTFSERDFGASSFREFIQRLDDQGLLRLRRIDQGYLVETDGEAGRGEGRREAAHPASRPAHATRPAHAVPRPIALPADGPDGAGDEEVVAGERDLSPAEGGPSPAETPATAGRRPEDVLGLLRVVVDRVAEARGGKPMYVRHLAQGLRAADPDFDEQAYGFRTLTDLVHLGQREGILRMQRDRQGAWRITSVASVAAPVSGVPGDGDAAPQREVAPGDVPHVAGPDDGEGRAGPSATVWELAGPPAGRDAIAAETGSGASDDQAEAVAAPDAGDVDAATASNRPTGRRKGVRPGGPAAKAPRAPKTAKAPPRASRPRGVGSRKKTGQV